MKPFTSQFTNPFTQSLMANVTDENLHAFVTDWDILEGLVVGIFRNKTATAADVQTYAQVRTELQTHLTQWQNALYPHWQGKKIGGQAAQSDPFAALIAPSHAGEFVGNLRLMQTLPAAREALNSLVIKIAK